MEDSLDVTVATMCPADCPDGEGEAVGLWRVFRVWGLGSVLLGKSGGLNAV